MPRPPVPDFRRRGFRGVGIPALRQRERRVVIHQQGHVGLDAQHPVWCPTPQSFQLPRLEWP